MNTYTLNKTTLDLKAAHDRYFVKKGKQEVLQQQFQEALAKAAKAQEQLALFEKVSVLLQKTSEFARQQAKARIEEIVTSALSVVFDTGYKFWLELTVRANRPECDYYLEADGVTVRLEQPDFGHGGGVIDVITLALRLAIAELEGVKGPLLLDEVGKHISAEYSANVAFFLAEYSKQFGRQIILVTHNDSLAAAGKRSFLVSQKSGRSEVKVL